MCQLLHGDCLEEMAKLADDAADMVLVDPPYGITACRWDSVIPLKEMWEQLLCVCKPRGAMVFMAAQPFTSALIMSNAKMFKYCWVWDKGQGTGFLNAKKQPLRTCEDVIVFYQQQCMYNPVMRQGFEPYVRHVDSTFQSQNYGEQTDCVSISDGSRYPITLLQFSRDKEKIHPTQKPVALMEYLIRTYTKPGDTVLDFCMGSGTTGVACKNLDRKFIGIEKDDGYFAIASQRVS